MDCYVEKIREAAEGVKQEYPELKGLEVTPVVHPSILMKVKTTFQCGTIIGCNVTRRDFWVAGESWWEALRNAIGTSYINLASYKANVIGA